MNTSTVTYIEKYIKQLSPIEKIAYQIAVQKLGSSFDIEKSMGYLEFVKNLDQISEESSST